MPTDKLNWGLLACGGIAHAFAKAMPHSKTGRIVACASRSEKKANDFGDEYDIPHRYGSYEELLADKDVDAVYISPPHPFHAEWAIKAAEAGKHILCEKPIGMNHPEAMAIIQAARENDVFLMEAFMYRCHPQTKMVVELLRQGVLGEVKTMEASFSFSVGNNRTGRHMAHELGGGGILDVGCYCASMARLVAGASRGGTFEDPHDVKGVGHIGDTRVDEQAAAVLRFGNGFVAKISTSVQVVEENVVRIYGTEGGMTIPGPWIIAPQGGTVTILVDRYDEDGVREVEVETDQHLYAIEADVVAENIDKLEAPFPCMSWDDTLGNMMTLDRWRHSFGLVYDQEKPENVPTIHRGPLRRRANANMQHGNIPGLDKPVPKLIMGVDNQTNMPHTAVMFDDYFERGGNAFDTAYIYMGGNSEVLLGQWIRSRGVRDDVVIIDKGAHTPQCDPDSLTAQLKESLGRLQTDYTDIYMMHRDNVDIPVGEFCDVLNEHQKAGRIKIFGVSNWSLERVREFNAYAEKHSLSPISIVSNQYSLASMLEPPWPGCLSSNDPDWRSWLAETQTALLPWSSQARGFFAAGPHPRDQHAPDMERCFGSKENAQRRERARELAEKKGVRPINIALAWVLHQPFPVYPLFGPRTLEETWIAMQGLDVELTEDEVRWLDLEG